MKSFVGAPAWALVLFASCSGEADAAKLHYWCAPNRPTELTWKQEVIRPPLTQVFIDTDAKTIRSEKEGATIVEFTDGKTHDTDDPHIGVMEHVYLNPNRTIVGTATEIRAPGYTSFNHYAFAYGSITFDLKTPAIMNSPYSVGQYCGAAPGEAIGRVGAGRREKCAQLRATANAFSNCYRACMGAPEGTLRCSQQNCGHPNTIGLNDCTAQD